MDDPQLGISIVMLAGLVCGFIAMSWHGYSQAVVMPLIASAFLILASRGAPDILRESFAEFAPVAIIFTAIAIPAHQIQRAGLFELIGAILGGAVGHASLRFPRWQIGILVGLSLFLTWASAGLFHNVTSILVMVPIVVAICTSYALPSRWLLCGALVASNLGGFSTAWGDTPNIIESKVWGLSHEAFFVEILPINFIILCGLTAAVTALTVREHRLGIANFQLERTAWNMAGFVGLARSIRLDRRLLIVGSLSLMGFLICQFIWPALEIAAAAGAILFAVAAERKDMRLRVLQSLDLDLYMTLSALFVIGHSINQSALGAFLQDFVASSGGQIWAIALSSYAGTGLTEAASWASAASPAVHQINPSHAAAWALGGGICAGSSSLLTAASAGIILWTESRRFEGHAVSFATYLLFGLVVSLAMLAFYVSVLTALHIVGVL